MIMCLSASLTFAFCIKEVLVICEDDVEIGVPSERSEKVLALKTVTFRGFDTYPTETSSSCWSSTPPLKMSVYCWFIWTDCPCKFGEFGMKFTLSDRLRYRFINAFCGC